MKDESTGYVCHECGNALEKIPRLTMLWCRRCMKRRRVPTHPALMSQARRAEAWKRQTAAAADRGARRAPMI